MAPKKENQFELSHKARTGFLVLLAVLVTLLIVWRVLPSLVPVTDDPEELELQAAWTKFKEANKNQEGYKYQERYSGENNSSLGVTPAPRLFPFDPNTITERELTALGLPPATIRTLLKYRSKGGRFYKKEDLAKLYTLRQEDYLRIAPYVQIVEEQNSRPAGMEVRKTTIPVVQSLELNSADAEGLIRLRGIGPAYARRILNFRDALGGFVTVAQLKEVYGFPDSTYQQLKDKFTITVESIKKIDLNSASEEQLASHPYIGKRLAGNIIRLRNDLKSFTTIEQVRQTPLINEEKYRKIAPYLSTH